MSWLDFAWRDHFVINLKTLSLKKLFYHGFLMTIIILPEYENFMLNANNIVIILLLWIKQLPKNYNNLCYNTDSCCIIQVNVFHESYTICYMILTTWLIIKGGYVSIINLIIEGFAAIHWFSIKMVSRRCIT